MGIAEHAEKMGSIGNLQLMPLSAVTAPKPLGQVNDGSLRCNIEESNQTQLLLQAQALLKKSMLYQTIDEALQKVYMYRPNVCNNLPQESDDDNRVTSLHRDAAVNNLRFLNIFYGYSPGTFALAINLLDRLLGKVKAHPKYLSCIATSCFYIAAKTQEKGVFIPGSSELVKLSQCGGTASDLFRMERLILEKLQWELCAITPLTFLQYFYELFSDQDPQLSNPSVLSMFVAKLEVLMCQFEFTKYRAETLALALLSHLVQDMGILTNMEQITAFVELQYYCQLITLPPAIQGAVLEFDVFGINFHLCNDEELHVVLYIHLVERNNSNQKMSPESISDPPIIKTFLVNAPQTHSPSAQRTLAHRDKALLRALLAAPDCWASISDCEFFHCRGLIRDYLQVYGSQPSKLPRLQLTWSVSRRTLNKIKPSTRVLLDLEPIMEDEVDVSDESDDAGPFDSENDDVDTFSKNFKMGSCQANC